MTEAITIELALAVLAGAGIVYGWIKSREDNNTEIIERLVRLETKLDGLATTVEKHNKVVERTFALENNLSTAFRRVDELRDEIRESKGEEK